MPVVHTERVKIYKWPCFNCWVPKTYAEPIESRSPKYENCWALERLMLNLKLQYFGHRMQSANSLEKTLMLGKIEGGRRRDLIFCLGRQKMDGWMASPTQGTRVWANSRRWWRTGKPGKLQSMVLQSWTRLSNWTKRAHTFTLRKTHLKGEYTSRRYLMEYLLRTIEFCWL